MAGVLEVVKPIQHYIKFPKIWIDNTIFRLHAKVNSILGPEKLSGISE
jgi:hypothetical protein